MRMWRTLRLRVKSLVWRRRVDQDLGAELREHLDRQIEANLAAGMTPQEARHAALREFGNVVLVEEQCRDARGLGLVEDLIRDLRFGLRSSLRTPAFTAVAVFSLALGIGANTAIFSLVNALMLRSLAVADPHALVEVGRITQYGRGNFSYPLYERLRDEQRSLASLITQSNTTVQADAAGPADIDPPIARFVSGNYFQALGLAPALGRLLLPEDDRLDAAAPPPAVISHAWWQRAFGARQDAVGATITINRVPFVIVGVAPRGFEGLEAGRPVDFLISFGSEPRLRTQSWLRNADFNWLSIVARLKPDVPIDAAQSDLAPIFARAMDEFAATVSDPADQRRLRSHRLTLAPAHAGLSGLRRQFGSPVLLLMGAVGLVLLIASANVVNLLLARAMARRREIALRLAIGASRGRLIRQLLTEATWLGVAGGALGLAFAAWGTKGLVALVANGDARFALDASPDTRVLLFTMGISIGASVLAALLPAFRTARVTITEVHDDARTMHAGPGHTRWSRALVVAQVALSVLILSGAALVAASVRNLRTMDAGFDRQVAQMGLAPGRAGITGARRLQYYRDVLDRVRAVPGIEGASLALITPISGSGVDLPLVVLGRSAEPGNMVYVNDVAEGYFDTMGTALVLGRDFAREDREDSLPVAVINEALARRYFPSSVPIGQRVRLGSRNVLEIVGVVQNAKYLSLREEDHPTIYVNALQKLDTGGLTLSVRAAGDSSGSMAAIRREVAAVAAAVPIGRTSLLSAEIDRSLVNERLMANLLGAFAALALLLACAGLYGVLGYAVARRTNEIGLRLALGATRRGVLWSVLRECARLVTVGVILGVSAAIVATRLLSDLLFGVTPTDARVFAAVVILVTAVAGVAAFRPAWRASRVDPWVALKHD